MTSELVLKAVLIGLILGLPTGPVGILSLRRALVGGWRAGLVSGLGSSLSDVVYVSIVRVGLSPLARIIDGQRFRLHVLGGLIVILVGSRIITRPPASFNFGRDQYRGLFRSAFLLSVTNPTMLISLPALFAAMRFPPGPVGVLGAIVTIVSVFTGSMVWWSAATRWLDRSGNALSDQGVKLVSTLAGVALILLGVISLSSLIA